MVSLKNILSFAILVTAVVAVPIYPDEDTLDFEARAVNFKCANKKITKENPKGSFMISEANAIKAMNHSPFDKKGKSGYPHQFMNGPGYTWGSLNIRCNRGKLYEFPVLQNGALYNFDKAPKDRPGPARVIYTITETPQKLQQKVFCGVIAHEGTAADDSVGPLLQCK